MLIQLTNRHSTLIIIPSGHFLCLLLFHNLIKRMKILPKRSISNPKEGKSIPTSIPRIMEEKIHKDNFLRLNEITKSKAINRKRAILNPVGSMFGTKLSTKNTNPICMNITTYQKTVNIDLKIFMS